MRRTLLGVAVIGLALQGCSADDDTAAAPTVLSAPSPRVTATAGLGSAPAPAGALDGKRQLFFLPRLDDTELPDAVLAVTNRGRIQVTDDYADRALFVPVPKGGGTTERLIKTGTLREGRKPLCLQVSGVEPEPRTVVTATCDPAEPRQLFTFEAAGKDDEGRTTYAVRNRDAFLQWHPLGEIGLIAGKPTDSHLETTFSLQDQGPAALPGTG